MYDYLKSKSAIENILLSKTKIEDKDKIPASDSEFTYTNGIRTWVGALFVDIVNSSELCKTPNEDTARILRAFCSEIIAILKDDSNYREIGIRGDCVYCIYTTHPSVKLSNISNYIICILLIIHKYERSKVRFSF